MCDYFDNYFIYQLFNGTKNKLDDDTPHSKKFHEMILNNKIYKLLYTHGLRVLTNSDNVIFNFIWTYTLMYQKHYYRYESNEKRYVYVDKITLINDLSNFLSKSKLQKKYKKMVIDFIKYEILEQIPVYDISNIIFSYIQDDMFNVLHTRKILLPIK